MISKKLCIFFILTVFGAVGCQEKADSVFEDNVMNVVIGVSTTDCINCRAVIIQVLKKLKSKEDVNVVVLFNVPRINKSQKRDFLTLGNEYYQDIRFLSSKMLHNEIKDLYQIEGNTYILIKSKDNDVLYKGGYKDISIVDINKVLFPE